MKPTCLCLVRHGETAWNAARRIQGQLDLPLSAPRDADIPDAELNWLEVDRGHLAEALDEL